MNVAVKMMGVAVALGMLSASVQATELESGFMDTQWSTPAQDLKGFQKVGGKGKFAYYENPKRTYTFFGSDTSHEVIYGFYEDKFFAVYADIEGIDIFSQAKSYIQRKYGPPSKTSRESRGGLTTYTWRLKQTQIKFKHYEASGKMKISFYYLPIAKKANAEMEKNLEAEPPGPVFLRIPREEADAPLEFMTF